MIDNVSIAVNTFARHILPSLSVDEILLLGYVNLSTNFKGLQLTVEKVTSHLKLIIIIENNISKLSVLILI